MKSRWINTVALLAVLFFRNIGITAPRAESAIAPATDPAQFFKNKIAPIIRQNCYRCHDGTKIGRLRLDSREEIIKGGKRGPAIVPGDPDNSLLIQAVRQTDRKSTRLT